MKYTVKLSYLQSEADRSFIYSNYIIAAADIYTAKNKAVIKLIKKCNPYHFEFNEAHEITNIQRIGA